MLSLMDVQCPHCHAQGRIITPPPGSVIVGPCPECQEMVVVFGGRVLALDKEIMLHGSVDARKDHMLEVINVFIEAKIEQLLRNAEQKPADSDEMDEPAEAFSPQPQLVAQAPKRKRREPISPEECATFVAKELHLLDNPQAFRALFD